ncbi:2-hydroxychromene-2-carboxylate isomerase [Rhodoferax aquaticus]|uniref:2-hydroxychromene-2-carboxylate isomerase n=1 Tax=Rhodoferax aquaticus TaxID=2527691 RepID=A0A515ETK6_9BURK|nr:2-hydroxychromene-2-carboxylate isomerase [Rhodoferax aquaticus]QDL56010.1 2-hydroxychromene-2-carboxylate isomerase [Rhodoferax aquaticus]
MKHITFYLDFISPYAYLAFESLPASLMGLSYGVTYKPVFLGGLLKHNAMLGPAEVPPKRSWIYRHVQWLAHSKDIPFDMPAVHPFNPLALLRLAIAAKPQGVPNRLVCETIFHHVWRGGADALEPQRIDALTATLAPAQDPNSQEVKDLLKRYADDAIAAQVFGVPAFEVDGKVFWGFDALPMLRSYLAGDPWFADNEADTHWNAAQHIPSGIPLRTP